MLSQIISQYLTTHKRIVVPQLGAFIVKAPGEGIVFSELLKRDDGVLRSLLQNAGMSELEAAGEISRLAFEARHAVEHGEEFEITGLGILKPGPNQTIVFEYHPTPSAESETAESSSSPEALEANYEPINPKNEQHTASSTEEKAENSFEQQPAAQTPIEMPKISPSVKLNPESHVKGLRYGKPPKNTNTYTYVNGKRRVDRFMIIAIVAAIIAVAAIVFGYIRASREEQAETELLHTPNEQLTDTQDTAISTEETVPQTYQQ